MLNIRRQKSSCLYAKKSSPGVTHMVLRSEPPAQESATRTVRSAGIRESFRLSEADSLILRISADWLTLMGAVVAKPQAVTKKRQQTNEA